MAQYVDGFVIPVPKKNIKAYIAIAKKAGKVWMEHGALSYVETMAEDVKKGKQTSFPQSVKLKSNEVVFFSWIVYKSAAHRKAVWKKVMNDPRMTDIMDMNKCPFDPKRMIYGGFKPMVSL